MEAGSKRSEQPRDPAETLFSYQSLSGWTLPGEDGDQIQIKHQDSLITSNAATAKRSRTHLAGQGQD